MFTATLLAAALSASQPGPEAYTGASPIQVASCSLVQAPMSIPGSYFGPIVSDSLNISFVNKNAKPIVKVEFAVSDGNTTIPVVDKGTFSTGVTINHSFLEPALTAGNVSCVVHAIAFADGNTWPADATANRSR